jgi:hypothetical protein
MQQHLEMQQQAAMGLPAVSAAEEYMLPMAGVQ